MKSILVVPVSQRKNVQISESSHEKAKERASEEGQSLAVWVSLLIEREYAEKKSLSDEATTAIAS